MKLYEGYLTRSMGRRIRDHVVAENLASITHQYAMLEAKLEEARSLLCRLTTVGEHEQDCSIFQGSPWECSCGWSEVVTMAEDYLDLKTFSKEEQSTALWRHRAITWWQEKSQYHPLTCGNDSNHENLVSVYMSEDDSVTLHCIDCNYIQTDIPKVVYDAYRDHQTTTKEETMGDVSISIDLDECTVERLEKVAKNACTDKGTVAAVLLGLKMLEVQDQLEANTETETIPIKEETIVCSNCECEIVLSQVETFETPSGGIMSVCPDCAPDIRKVVNMLGVPLLEVPDVRS